MDAVIVEKSLYADVLAFVRTMHGACDGCFRKGVQCRDCDVRVADGLVRRLEECDAPKHVSDNRIVRRIVEVLEEIRNSDSPVSSRQITLMERCTKAEKYKAIRFLIAHGIVETKWSKSGVILMHVPSYMGSVADAIIQSGEINL